MAQEADVNGGHNANNNSNDASTKGDNNIFDVELERRKLCFSNELPIQLNSSSSTQSSNTQAAPTATPCMWFRLCFRDLCYFCLATPMFGLSLCLLIAVIFQFEHIQEDACKLPLCYFCLATPMFGLSLCLSILVIFQFEYIQEHACKVSNVVPSISAVTGISPGRYVWRVSIAFHLGPRLLILSAFYHYLLTFLPGAKDPKSLSRLLKAVFYLQIAEIVGLCGISFIHNREHYPIHEKCFLVYLFSSHSTFFVTLFIYSHIWPQLDATQRGSYYKKLFTFCFSFACLFLMAYFFYRHRVHCDNWAFSIFAFVEYFVAAANMFYYWTIVYDLPDEEIQVVKPAQVKVKPVNGHHPKKEL